VPGVLHISVILGGIGIALAAGLVPGIVREQMPGAIGAASGMWTASMFAGAALAAGLSVPIALWTGSWQEALAVWAIPAAAAWVLWTIVERPYAERGSGGGGGLRLRSLPWRSGPAWALTAYMAVNSIVFYSTVAWTATSYEERGWSPEASGLLFAISAAGQVLAALTLPWIAHRFRGLRTLLAITTAVTIVTLVLIGVAPAFVPALVLVVFGFVHSGGFAVSLSLLSSYAADASASARLTAMAYSVTYVIAATGPIVTGAIVQWSGSWALVFGVLAAVTAIQFPAIAVLRRDRSVA
jgi:CP family cyanate transporter-like MFS transporter